MQLTLNPLWPAVSENMTQKRNLTCFWKNDTEADRLDSCEKTLPTSMATTPKTWAWQRPSCLPADIFNSATWVNPAPCVVHCQRSSAEMISSVFHSQRPIEFMGSARTPLETGLFSRHLLCRVPCPALGKLNNWTSLSSKQQFLLNHQKAGTAPWKKDQFAFYPQINYSDLSPIKIRHLQHAFLMWAVSDLHFWLIFSVSGAKDNKSKIHVQIHSVFCKLDSTGLDSMTTTSFTSPVSNIWEGYTLIGKKLFQKLQGMHGRHLPLQHACKYKDDN